MSDIGTFKVCSLCKTTWQTREELLQDPDVELIGYQANFEALQMGQFFFNHLREDCHTTFSISATEFRDLYGGPVFEQQLAGSTQCEGFCLDQVELRDCEACCECAYVRHILRIIREWPKCESTAVPDIR